MRTFLQRPKRSVHRNLEKEDKEVRTRKVVVRYVVGDKGLPVRGRCTPGDPLLPKLSFQTCLQHLQKNRCHGFKGGAWSSHTCSVGSLGMREGSPWKGEHIVKGLVGGAAVCCTHEERRWMSLREEKHTC